MLTVTPRVECQTSVQQVVAVHGGAGNHTLDSERAIRHALRNACTNALNCDGSPLDIIENAISALEDDAALNAGYGANLTMDGMVECDAALMGADGAFGSVGALLGVRNPIRVARAVLDIPSRATAPFGRVPPLTLVGDGARRLASEENRVAPETMISPHARTLWEQWRTRLVADQPVMQDTVGAVYWAGEADTQMAAGVSSGGILLKLPGRIGEAAVFGAGCWATRGVACSISGTGEDIVRTALARTISEAIVAGGPGSVHDVLHDVLTRTFHEVSVAQGETAPSAGVILLVREDDASSMRLWCAFTTDSMAVGYAVDPHTKPKALILRRPAYSGVDGTPSVYITALPLQT